MKKGVKKMLRRINKWLSGKDKRAQVGIKESWKQMPKEFEDDLTMFFNWFDAAGSVEEALKKGEADWKFRFESSEYFGLVPKRAALEIGFGAGRILIPASRVFDRVYGIDIHESFKQVGDLLRQEDVKNVELLRQEEMEKIADQSIDFVYSFIVFQHFESLEEVRLYLSEIKRILSRKGYASLYVGKNDSPGVRTVSADSFKVRNCSLYINPKFMEELLEQFGFKVLRLQKNLPKDPVKGQGVSGQFAVEFAKAP